MTRLDNVKVAIKEKEAELNKIAEEYELNLNCLKEEFEIKQKHFKSVIDALKIELADIILNSENQGEEQESEDCNLRTMVSVEFKEGGKSYDYMWDSTKPVAIGDTVKVERKWGGFSHVTVVDVFKADLEKGEYADIDYKSAYPMD